MPSLRLSEARKDIVGSTVFRLTLRFAAIFVVCLLVFNVALGLTARWRVEYQAMARVDEEFGTLTRNLRDVSVGIAHELRSPLTRIHNRLVEIKFRFRMGRCENIICRQ